MNEKLDRNELADYISKMIAYGVLGRYKLGDTEISVCKDMVLHCLEHYRIFIGSAEI
jgi:hypothetical protein